MDDLPSNGLTCKRATGAIYAASAMVSLSGSAQVQMQGSSLVVSDLNVSGSASIVV
jgi:hypothetical protein